MLQTMHAAMAAATALVLLPPLCLFRLLFRFLLNSLSRFL